MPELPEPPSKRQKTEENLIPEDMFLMRNKGPVTFNVSDAPWIVQMVRIVAQ